MFESRSLKEAKSGMSHISPHATADAGGTFERSACRFACILVFRAIVELGDGAVNRAPDMQIPTLCLLREWGSWCSALTAGYESRLALPLMC
jgi:hypothetical protein